MLVTGAAIGVFPVKFGTYGEIADTKCRSSLQSKFGLFLDDDQVSAESATILNALSHYTGRTSMYLENICCKAVQASITKTLERWKDSYYPDQRGLYTINNTTQSPTVELYTNEVVQVCILPKHINKQLHGDFLNECFQTSTCIFEQKTTIATVQKKQKSATRLGRIKFDPFSKERIIMCDFKHRHFLNMEKMVMSFLGHDRILRKEDVLLKRKTKRYTVKRKKITTPWYRMDLNTTSPLTKKKVTFDVPDEKALIPIGLENTIIQNYIYFKEKNAAKEYMLVNYILMKCPELLTSFFAKVEEQEEEHDCHNASFRQMCHFTIVERNYRLKNDMMPHYILTTDYKNKKALLFYLCNISGSTLQNKKHWKAIPREPIKQGIKRKRNAAQEIKVAK